jgi:predicted kinase
VLIVFGGLPGVGKTTLSRSVAQELGAAYLRIDTIETAMWRAGLGREQTGLAAYQVANAVARANLGLGAPVVVDAVNPVEAARAGWLELATASGSVLRVVEVNCGDPAEHRRRVEEREPDTGQAHVPSWSEVQDREYEPWTEPRLTVDTVEPPSVLIPRILRYVRG